MPTKINLSFTERLGVIAGVLKAIARVLAAFVVTPFQCSNGPKIVSRHLSFAISRAVASSLTTRQMVSFLPSTGEVYKKALASRGVKTDSISLIDGTQAHWIGDSTAEKLLLYFHGGGYVLPAVEGHFNLLLNTTDNVKRKGHNIGILFLQYDIAVESPYPRQLQQAAMLLEHTLGTLKKSSEQIILAGDSAGGNLILALLSHILHPHPEIAPNKLSGKFAGVALLSPWVTFDTEKAASMRTNKVRDALAIPLLNQWSAAFQDGVPSDPYQEPLSAPNDWFKDLPVRNVLILAGADEIFVDDIAKFTDILRRVFPTVVSEITPDEAHDQLVMETTMKLPMSQQRTIFQNWISENCRIRESSSSKLTLMTVLLSYALVKKRLV